MRRRADGGLLVVDRLVQKHAERGQIVVVRAGVVLPSVHEDDQDHVLPACGGSYGASASSLSATRVHLPPVVAPPLIVKLDDRELVRSAGHEAVKRLMLLVRHDPGWLPGSTGARPFRPSSGHARFPLFVSAINIAAFPLQENISFIAPTAPHEVRSITVGDALAPRAVERGRYPALAAGHAAKSARSAATKASGWSIIT